MIGIGEPVGSGRVLDFDIENRPLTYWAPDRPTAEITAIASAWVDSPDSLQVCLLGQMSGRDMLALFVERYNQADLVTGHFIRRHDLPHINGALLELGMPTLRPKLTSDTMLDLVKRGDLPATQEYLLELLGIKASKYHMTQAKWREANRLTEKGLAQTFNRVSSDVLSHTLMWRELQKRKLLGPPRMWYPSADKNAKVTH